MRTETANNANNEIKIFGMLYARVFLINPFRKILYM